jgi:hypothetical protein
MDCRSGDVCGRFDFRGLDPDSGMYSGPTEDVVHVCRPRLNAVCGATNPCAQTGQSCAGSPGVCSTYCTQDSDCASRLCIPPTTGACGLPGLCAPLCDDALECPQGWYCNLVNADTSGHGRCESIEPMTGGDAGSACFDAGM